MVTEPILCSQEPLFADCFIGSELLVSFGQIQYYTIFLSVCLVLKCSTNSVKVELYFEVRN